MHRGLFSFFCLSLSCCSKSWIRSTFLNSSNFSFLRLITPLRFVAKTISAFWRYENGLIIVPNKGTIILIAYTDVFLMVKLEKNSALDVEFIVSMMKRISLNSESCSSDDVHSQSLEFIVNINTVIYFRLFLEASTKVFIFSWIVGRINFIFPVVKARETTDLISFHPYPLNPILETWRRDS